MKTHPEFKIRNRYIYGFHRVSCIIVLKYLVSIERTFFLQLFYREPL